MSVLIGSARSDENGRAHGGKAGDQKDGREVSTQSWYRHRLGWRTFRCKDPVKAGKMAEAMRWFCGTDLIGYDQYQRNTLYSALEAVLWDYTRLKLRVETDCSALIRVCAACVGIFLPDFNTSGEAKALLNSGWFVELKGGKYNDQDDYLGMGDVQVTSSKGHTVMVLTNGRRYEGVVAEKEYVPGVDVLNTDTPKCEAVAVMQQYLIDLGYDLGRYGADGDFGECTEIAVMEFQREHGCDDDGEYGPITHAAMVEALEARNDPNDGRIVRIENGQCWIRTAPDCGGEKLTVAKRGSEWPFDGEAAENGWLAIEYENRRAWVSGRYGKVC